MIHWLRLTVDALAALEIVVLAGATYRGYVWLGDWRAWCKSGHSDA